MKIAGRIIQNKNISVSTEDNFCATYKKHQIKITLRNKTKFENSDWSCEVRTFNGVYSVETVVNRFNIYDAIVYCLDHSLL